MSIRIKKWSVVLLAAVLAVPGVKAAEYTLDDSHTSIGFAVKHMVISNVRGSFGKFSGSLTLDENDVAGIKASASVDVASIDTANEKRDEHLRSPDFFDAATHPAITFEVTRAEGTWPSVTLIGNLTIKGVTKEVSLPVEFSGPVVDPWGNTRIGFAGNTTINRQDFGVSWSKTLDGGGLVVSDTVKIEIEAEAIRK